MEEQTAQPEVQPQELQEETVEVTSQHETNEENVETPATEEPTPEASESEPAVEEPEWVPEPIEPPRFQRPEVKRPRMNDFVNPQTNEVDIVAYEAAMDQYESAREQALDQGLQDAFTKADKVAEYKTTYQREWAKAEDKYQELKTNKQLKDMVFAIHSNSAQPGFKYLSPMKAAEQLFGIRGEAKSEGIRAAQESRTVQAAASLGNPNPPAPAQSGDRLKQLKDGMKTGTKVQRQQATQAYLKELMESGKL